MPLKLCSKRQHQELWKAKAIGPRRICTRLLSIRAHQDSFRLSSRFKSVGHLFQAATWLIAPVLKPLVQAIANAEPIRSVWPCSGKREARAEDVRSDEQTLQRNVASGTIDTVHCQAFKLVCRVLRRHEQTNIFRQMDSNLRLQSIGTTVCCDSSSTQPCFSAAFVHSGRCSLLCLAIHPEISPEAW